MRSAPGAGPPPPPSSYGASAGGTFLGPAAGFLPPFHGKRKVFSNVEFNLLVLAPAFCCIVIYALFANVFQQAWATVAFVIVFLVAGSIIVGLTYGQGQYRLYLSGFTLAAICSATAVGLVSYKVAFSRYWYLHESNSYTNVLPSESAAGFADAGKIVFADGVRVDADRAVGFRDRSVYCVAPIVDEAHTGLVEFWAVGKDCCATRGSFWCGDAWNAKARSGVVVPDGYGEYRNAIKLAEAAMGVVTAERPLLVDWVVDPERVEANFRRVGIAILIGAFLVQVLLLGLAATGLNLVLRNSPNLFR